MKAVFIFLSIILSITISFLYLHKYWFLVLGNTSFYRYIGIVGIYSLVPAILLLYIITKIDFLSKELRKFLIVYNVLSISAGGICLLLTIFASFHSEERVDNIGCLNYRINNIALLKEKMEKK